jgi:Ca2+:H+ antiporter
MSEDRNTGREPDDGRTSKTNTIEDDGGKDSARQTSIVHRPSSIVGRSPLITALEWIGLDMSGPDRSSKLLIGIYALLVFIPAAVIVRLFHLGDLWLFVTSAAAIVPLAKILGTATEELALRVGAGIGGLLNATFGNAVEMIIAIFALQAGLYEVVKASITGSILGNVLFVLGLSIFLGGLGRDKQTFNRTAASVVASQLTLAIGALVIPAAFAITSPQGSINTSLKEALSIGVALALLVSYVAQLIFFLRTHKHLYTEEEAADMHGQAWTVRHSVIVLLGSTMLVAVMSEILVEGVGYLTHELGLTEIFVGVILVALIGNAAEHLTAVTVAIKNKMDLAVSIAMGSTLQVALFVAPVLVLIGFLIGRPLDLFFNLFELAALGVTMLIATSITHDGESNWFEGVQLLATYAIVAVAFFFHP